MIIDTHAQLWTKEAIESFPKAMAESYKNMFKDIGMPSIEGTLKDMDDAGVDKSVIVAIDAETVVENGEIKIKRRKLYDTTLQRAIELCNTFAEFNVSRDAALEEARVSLLRALEGVTIDQLRDSDTKRVVVKEIIHSLRKKEHDADGIEDQIKLKVFNLSEDPIVVFHTVRLAEIIGSIADHAENAGDMMRAMVAR